MAVFDVNNLIIVIILAEVQCFVKDLFLKKKKQKTKNQNPYFHIILFIPKPSILPGGLRKCHSNTNRLSPTAGA